MITSSGRTLLAVVLAWNYFAFQVELFDAEYDANHPLQATEVSLAAPVLTWESFDKDQAPPPYVFDAGARLEVVSLLPPVPPQRLFPSVQANPVRDKSPPSSLVTS